jgi:hypothetical protein
VFSLIPERRAALDSDSPLPSSILNLLTCLSVNICPPSIRARAYETSVYEDRNPAILIVVTQQF